MLTGVNFTAHGGLQFSPRGTCFKGSVHSHLSAESSKNHKGSEMEWKQCAPSSEKPQGETTSIKHMLIIKENYATLLFEA